MAAIRAARDAGLVRGGMERRAGRSLPRCAGLFGLSAEDIYSEINRDHGLVIMTNILCRDLAYSVELASRTKAEALVRSFLDEFEAWSSGPKQYYTNGTLGLDDHSGSWKPATAATLDTGVLVLSASHVACLWVEDED